MSAHSTPPAMYCTIPYFSAASGLQPLEGSPECLRRSHFFTFRRMPMKLHTFLAQALLATLCAAAVFAGGQAGEKDLFQQYLEKFGPPGPEHKLLEPLVGTWHASCKMWHDPSQKPHESDGTLVRKAVMGARFIQEDFDGKMM